MVFFDEEIKEFKEEYQCFVFANHVINKFKKKIDMLNADAKR